MLILTGDEIRSLVQGREEAIMTLIGQAYRAHGRGETSLPHSVFLRFPDNAENRIIGLPAYLGGEVNMAGMKWISSFPKNVSQGVDRASAAMILNGMESGRPEALLEGSIISAKRTAASAALAADLLSAEGRRSPAGFVGCGVINFEVARFLMSLETPPQELVVFDLSEERGRMFLEWCRRAFPGVRLKQAGDLEEVLGTCPLLSFATTAIEPHLSDLSLCRPGTTLLHVSLRDLSPEVILSCDNVVDDLDHVCRAGTSIHLAEQKSGDRSFVRCGIDRILDGSEPARASDDGLTVFSPFGLGILDIALADYVLRQARVSGLGTVVESFLPTSVSEFERKG